MIIIKSKLFLGVASIGFLLFTGCGQQQSINGEDKTRNPNILLIVADDLGYSDIAPFGGNIRTPVLNQLAKEGMRFSNFHVLPTCSPTRSSLLTGSDNHIAGMGVMGELSYPDIEGMPGYEGYLNTNVVTIAEILIENGYHTYMCGKWHLGEQNENSPFKRGFEETFALMNGGGSHWADQKPLSPPQAMIYRKNGKRISSLPDDFYSTKNYTDSLMAFINKNKDSDNPFFAYLSYTAPHDPLHAPEEYIKKYNGIFHSGWDQMRVNRLNRLKELELISKEVSSFSDNQLVPKWESLSEDQRFNYARDMEVYAAMVEYMDMSIGRLFNFLIEIGEYNNTLIIFFSDNGANGAHPTAYPGNADGEYLNSFDNEIENRGFPNSFIDMGPGWAQASSSPFKLYKSFTSEGGIKSPLIIKKPGIIDNSGQWNHGFIHVTDILPTILGFAQANYPEIYRNTAVKQPIGKSIIQQLNGALEDNYIHTGIGWELFEMKAYIKGKWKILRLPEPFGSGKWELYDLNVDPGELNDISEKFPNKKNELLLEWDDYVKRNGVYDHKGHYDEVYRKLYLTDH